MDRDKDLNETEKTEKEKSVNNVQKIFHVFNDNLDGVNLYFRKFESIAIGEDETMKDESSNFFKEVLLALLLKCQMRNWRVKTSFWWMMWPIRDARFFTPFSLC